MPSLRSARLRLHISTANLAFEITRIDARQILIIVRNGNGDADGGASAGNGDGARARARARERGGEASRNKQGVP